jgi:hypothetical protein
VLAETGESIMVWSKARGWFGFCSAVPGIALLLMVTAAGVGNAKAATHYIANNGSDASDGTSKTTPWAHLPGMNSCVGNCARNTPTAGDLFLLRGCDVWTPSDFPVNWQWSGSVGSRIYIGVDKTWYNATNCPSGWNRPVFDGQNTYNDAMVYASSGSSTTSYVTLDNIEMTRNAGFNHVISWNPTFGWTMSNLYIHAWHRDTDDCRIIQFEAGSPAINLFTNSIIDGSDSTGAAARHSCYGFYPTPPSVTNSVIHDLVNPIVGYAGGGSNGSTLTVSGNNIYNVNDSYLGNNHGNAVEFVGGGTYYIYNNLIHHMVCSGCESMMIGDSGFTGYVWNNVIWDLGSPGSQAQTPSVPEGDASGFTVHFWNNTIVATDAQACINNSGKSISSYTVTAQNIHCIQGSSGGSVTAYTDSGNNLLQTLSQANAQGYSATQANAYSPTSGTNGTVGTGANLTSACTGANAGLCSDTTYACAQQTISGVVQAVCQTRTSRARPSSGAWDIGAYEFSSGGGGTTPPAPPTTPPAPPTNLRGVVN